jgi:hypothetical protein
LNPLILTSEKAGCYEIGIICNALSQTGGGLEMNLKTPVPAPRSGVFDTFRNNILHLKCNAGISFCGFHIKNYKESALCKNSKINLL